VIELPRAMVELAGAHPDAQAWLDAYTEERREAFVTLAAAAGPTLSPLVCELAPPDLRLTHTEVEVELDVRVMSEVGAALAIGVGPADPLDRRSARALARFQERDAVLAGDQLRLAWIKKTKDRRTGLTVRFAVVPDSRPST
jgi:hypothetical protein